MIANKGVVFTLAVFLMAFKFSTVGMCQPQVPGAALENPIGPENLVVAPRPENISVIAASPGDHGNNVIGGKKRQLLQDGLLGGVIGADNEVRRNVTTLFPQGSSVSEQQLAEFPAPEVSVVIAPPTSGGAVTTAPATTSLAGTGAQTVVVGDTTTAATNGGTTGGGRKLKF